MNAILDEAHDHYLARFRTEYGERADGAFVKFGKHMIQKLSRTAFPERYEAYVRLHRACKQMIASGSTINDALVYEFAESSAWMALEAPDMLALFKGEIGDVDDDLARRTTRR
jgi:hypothetical protein